MCGLLLRAWDATQVLAAGRADVQTFRTSLGREVTTVAGYQGGIAPHTGIRHRPMHREPVSSSMIAAIGYSEEGGMLEVEFVSNRVCRYYGVSPDVYEDFRAARSKGTYFNRRIRDAYPWEYVKR
jgi:hypothetical protein